MLRAAGYIPLVCAASGVGNGAGSSGSPSRAACLAYASLPTVEPSMSPPSGDGERSRADSSAGVVGSAKREVTRAWNRVRFMSDAISVSAIAGDRWSFLPYGATASRTTVDPDDIFSVGSQAGTERVPVSPTRLFCFRLLLP